MSKSYTPGLKVLKNTNVSKERLLPLKGDVHATLNQKVSSSDVVANDFDKTTGKYHAGTSGGRSDFIGLQRVSHSSTAVSTHITANSGIIVEQ